MSENINNTENDTPKEIEGEKENLAIAPVDNNIVSMEVPREETVQENKQVEEVKEEKIVENIQENEQQVKEEEKRDEEGGSISPSPSPAPSLPEDAKVEGEGEKKEEETSPSSVELEEGEILEEEEEEDGDEEDDEEDDEEEDEEEGEEGDVGTEEDAASQRLTYSKDFLISLQPHKNCQQLLPTMEKEKNQLIVLKDFNNALLNNSLKNSNQNSGGQNKKAPRKKGGKGGYNNRGQNNNNNAANAPRRVNTSNPNAWNVPDRNTESEEGRRLEFNRKVNGMLNKLTLENFDSLNVKLIDLIMSCREFLNDVINSIFDKALGEPKFSMVYSKLCQVIYHKLDKIPEPINFRVMLVNKCQEQFNTKFTDQYLTDEEYSRIKQRYLGNIKFIGELFLSKLLPSRVIVMSAHLLIKGNGKEVEEEDLESLCKLLTTTGKNLEQQLTNLKPSPSDPTPPIQQLDALFDTLHSLSTLPTVSNRIKYMILDLEELRNEQWIPRRKFEGPMKIAEVRREVKKMEKDIKKIEKDIKKFDEKPQRGGGGGKASSHSVPNSPRRSNPLNNSGESNDNSFSPHHRGKGGNNKDDNSWTVKGGRGKNNNNNNNNQSLSNSNPNHVPPHLQSQGWKVKSDTNVKNPFASLEQEKPRKEVSFAKAKVKANSPGSFAMIVDDYFYSLDEVDLKESLADMEAKDVHHHFITCLIQRTTKKDRIPNAANLIKYLFDNDLLLPSHLLDGLIEVIKGMEEIKEDFPNAPSFLGELLSLLHSSSLFSYSSFPNILDESLGLSSFDQSKLLLSFLSSSLSLSSVEEVGKKIKEEQLDVLKYIPLEKLEREEALADLTKLLKEN